MSSIRTAEPRLLIIETSGRPGWVATALGGDYGPERMLEASRRHARDLAPAIVELCRERGWRVRDLDGVAVSRGPGSYTGLRVGLMTAKTLAYALKIPLLAIDTFAAVALQAPPEAAIVDVLADGQQRHLYVQRFERQAHGWQAATALGICPAAQWRAQLSADVWVTGPGLALVESELSPDQPRVTADRRDPQPRSLLTLALARWNTGELDDFWSAEPLYLRPSNAEVNWDLRKSATNA